MGVHPGAVVLEEGLGHERRGLAPLPRGVLRAVLVPEDLVGHLGQRVEAHVDLGLAAGRHLVVVHLDADADRLERQHHVRPDILELVHRRHREVALLVAWLVAEVRLLGCALLAGVPGAGLGVDEVVPGGVRSWRPSPWPASVRPSPSCATPSVLSDVKPAYLTVNREVNQAPPGARAQCATRGLPSAARTGSPMPPDAVPNSPNPPPAE